MNSIRTVTTIYARVDKVICPHCDCDVEGWQGDPRIKGSVQTCDECGGQLTVEPDAEVRLV